MEENAMDVTEPLAVQESDSAGEPEANTSTPNNPIVDNPAHDEILMAVDSTANEQDMSNVLEPGEEPSTQIIVEASLPVDSEEAAEGGEVANVDESGPTVIESLDEQQASTTNVDDDPLAVATATDPVVNDLGWGPAAFGNATSTSGWGDAATGASCQPDTTASLWGINEPSTTRDKEADTGSGWGSKKRTSSEGNRVSWGDSGWGKGSNSFNSGEAGEERSSGWRMNRDRAAWMSHRNDTSDLLPPLGRSSPQKVANRVARRNASAPYHFGSRDRDNMRDESFPEQLDYGGSGDALVQSTRPAQQVTPAVDLVSRFKMMDMSSFGNELMNHLNTIMKTYAKEQEAHEHMQVACATYNTRKSRFNEQIRVEMDAEKKKQLSIDLDQFKSQMVQQEKTLIFLINSSQDALKREMDEMMKTVARTLGEKIQASVSEVMRAIGGPTCDVPAIIERCVNLTAPHLLRDYIPSQEILIKAMERKLLSMNMTLKNRDETISQLTDRMERLERRLEMMEGMQSKLSPSDATAAPEASGEHRQEVLDALRTVPDILSSPSKASSGYSSVLAGFVNHLSATSKKLLQ